MKLITAVYRLVWLGLLASCGGGSSEPPAAPNPTPNPNPSQNINLSAWQTVAANGTPGARHEAAFVAVADKLYLLGGRRIQPVSIYTPATRGWASGAMPPVEVHHFQAVVVSGRIWLVGAMTGGFPNEVPLDYIPVYDPASDVWSRGPSLPTDRRRGGAGAVVLNGQLYVVGGITNGHQSGNVAWLDRLDIASGQWSRLPDAPRARDHFQAAIVGQKLYAAGGRQTMGAQGMVFNRVLAPVDVYDIAVGAWATLPSPEGDLPAPRAGSMSLALNDRYVVVGGGESLAQNTAHAEVHALDTTTGRWTAWSSFVQGRHGSGIERLGDVLYVASGSGNRGGSPELTTIESAQIQP
jgi:N-acetylneuraminic acid mutarotase